MNKYETMRNVGTLAAVAELCLIDLAFCASADTDQQAAARLAMVAPRIMERRREIDQLLANIGWPS